MSGGSALRTDGRRLIGLLLVVPPVSLVGGMILEPDDEYGRRFTLAP